MCSAATVYEVHNHLYGSLPDHDDLISLLIA